MKKLLLFLFCFTAYSATYTASSPSQSDVEAKIFLTVNGDTVIVPSGSAYWTGSTIVTNKAIQVIGAGIGQTIIYDANAARGGLIQFQTQANEFVRFSGFEFRSDGTNSGINFFGVIQAIGFSKAIRFDHLKFDHVSGMNIVWSNGEPQGVIDHCVFLNGGNNHAVRVFHNQWGGPSYTFGDGSWYLPLTFGTTNAVYIESCNWVNDVAGIALTDGFAGARIVLRYSQGTNGYFNTHGTESTGRQNRGAVQHEMYGCYIDSTFNTPALFRSGTAMIFSNIFKNFAFNSLCQMDDYNMVFPFFYGGGWNGTNGYCSNSPTLYYTGAASSGSSLSVTVSGAGWTTNQWKGYTIQNASVSTFNVVTVIPYSPITGNTATTITFSPSLFGTNVYFNTGQIIRIYKVLETLDQPGHGPGYLLSGDPPMPIQYAYQSISPLYAWSNTNLDTVGIMPLQGNDLFPNIVEGRHFTNASAILLNGYIPLVFPHPLVTDSPIPPPPAPPVIQIGNAIVSGQIILQGNTIIQ